MSGSHSAGSKRRKGSDEKKRKKKGKSRWRNMQKYKHTNNGFLVLLSFFQPATIRCKHSPFLLRKHWSTWRRLSFFFPSPPFLSLSLFFFLFFCTLCSGPCAKTFFFSCHKLHASRFTCFTVLNFGGGQRGLNYVSVSGLSGIKLQCHTERFEI